MPCQEVTRVFRPGQDVQYRYLAHGLIVNSQISLPQLRALSPESAQTPDVTIVFGPVAEPVVSQPGHRRGLIRGQFRYEVREGRHIVIDRLRGFVAKNVADGIMSRVLTVLVYQRGMLPLHASAVATANGVVGICGQSGAGKSTLAAALVAAGGVIVADDILVLGHAGTFEVFHGACGFKLSDGSLHHIGRSSVGLDLANEVEGKYFLPVASNGPTTPLLLDRVVLLREGSPEITPASRLEALAEWTNCVRMPELINTAPNAKAVWQRWADLTTAIDLLYVAHGRRMAALSPIVAYLNTPYALTH